MKKLGNVVISRKNNDFNDIFNVVSSCEDIDDTLPTLYVGLSLARKCIDKFSILKKHYEEQNCWWTFSKTERRNEYVEDVESFKDDVINDVLGKVEYIYVNFVCYSLTRLKSLVTYILSDSKKICFITSGSNFIFIYDVNINKVFGLSLTLCEYVGIAKQKAIKLIKRCKHNIFVKDLSFLDGNRRVVGTNLHYVPILYACFSE